MAPRKSPEARLARHLEKVTAKVTAKHVKNAKRVKRVPTESSIFWY